MSEKENVDSEIICRKLSVIPRKSLSSSFTLDPVLTCTNRTTLPRRSFSAKFNDISWTIASSVASTSLPSRKSIVVPQILDSDSLRLLPRLRRSIVNPYSTDTKDKQTVPAVSRCNIKSELMNPTKVLAVKSLNKNNENISKTKNKPLKAQPFVIKKAMQIEPVAETNIMKVSVENFAEITTSPNFNE